MSSILYPEGAFSEITSNRSVRGANFAQGSMDYTWSIGAPNVFIPAESYFVVDMTLNVEGRQPTMADEIAFANDPASCLFDNAYMRLSGQSVSSVVNFLPQTAIIRKRLLSPQGWLKTMGKSSMGLESSFVERQKTIAYDANTDYSTSELLSLSTGGQATIAVTAATGAVVGVNTDFTILDVGRSYFIVEGLKLIVSAVTNATNCTVLIVNDLTTRGDIATTANFEAYLPPVDDKSRGNNRVFVLFQPPIGFFEHSAPMGAGDYRISLNPATDYKKAAVETISALTVGAGASQFDLTVNDIKFYVASYKAVPSNIPMQLNEIQVQSKTLSGGTEQFQFTVPLSAVGIGFFIQANGAGNDTRYPPTKFKTSNDEQDTLTSYQITYANTTKPQTRWGGDLDETGVYPATIKRLTLQQRYHDTFASSGTGRDPAGCETMQGWLENGQVVYHNFNRDDKNNSTQVQFSITTSQTGGFTEPTKLYLFANYTTKIDVVTENGLIVQVSTLTI